MQAIGSDDADQEEKLVFCCLQLLKLACMTDLEEGSRPYMVMVHSDSRRFDLMEGCMEVLFHTQKDCKQTECIDSVTEVLAELFKLSESASEASLQVNFTLCILSIAIPLLETVPLPLLQFHSTLVEMEMQHIVPTLDSPNEFVREAAVSCVRKLGLCSLQALNDVLDDISIADSDAADSDQASLEDTVEDMNLSDNNANVHSPPHNKEI
jgi:hypothetical protein